MKAVSVDGVGTVSVHWWRQFQLMGGGEAVSVDG